MEKNGGGELVFFLAISEKSAALADLRVTYFTMCALGLTANTTNMTELRPSLMTPRSAHLALRPGTSASTLRMIRASSLANLHLLCTSLTPFRYFAVDHKNVKLPEVKLLDRLLRTWQHRPAWTWSVLYYFGVNYQSTSEAIGGRCKARSVPSQSTVAISRSTPFRRKFEKLLQS